MKPDSKNYLDWFKKANEDELNIKSILRHRDGTPSAVCFMSQQMAEKYLKGLLVFLEKPFRKVHDLIDLETLLVDFYAGITAYHDDFALLNRFYVKTRYPGDYPEFSWADGEKAYEVATRIKEFVLDKIH